MTSIMTALRNIYIRKPIWVQGVAVIGREITLGRSLDAVIIPLVATGNPSVTGENQKTETQKWVENVEWDGTHSVRISRKLTLKVSETGRVDAL
jgi:hypothetical protein